MDVIFDKTKKKVRCRLCNSILAISSKDVFTDYYDYMGIPNIDTYFYCPCCGAKNIIS